MSEDNERILKERYFYAKNMSNERFDEYFGVLKQCEEIINTKYPIGDTKSGEFVDLCLEETKDGIVLSGSLSYSFQDISENRTIYGIIYDDKTEYIIDMLVTRVCHPSDPYRIVEQIKKEDYKEIEDKTKKRKKRG